MLISSMRPTERERAYTLPELVVSAGVVALFLFLFMAEVGEARHRPKQDRINCINNLKNLSLAARIFLTDNPQYGLGNTTALTAAEFFRSITNELSSAPRILLCPADHRMEAPGFSTLSNQNVSYFVGPSARTNHLNSLFAGDRNLQTNGVPVPSGSIVSVLATAAIGSSSVPASVG